MSNFLPESDPMFIHDAYTDDDNTSDQDMEIIEMQAMEETMLEFEESVPENTKKAYNPKIKEFKEWCNRTYTSIPIEERFTVTGPKLHEFLKTMVVNRVNKRKGRENKVIQLATIYQYVAAITHYYQMQVSTKVNTYPHPRTTCVSILKACRLREENAGRTGVKYRGLNDLVDAYITTDEIASMSYYYISRNMYHDLRNCTAFLLSHFCLLRGESARAAEFPDLQVVNIENEGPTGFCPALVIVMRNGKLNESGRLDIGACIRNVDVRICPFMILAMYLFSMFQIENRPFPDFADPQNWYHTKLLQTGKDSKKEWSYSAQYHAMEKSLKACKIGHSKVVHMARGAGAHMCDFEVDESTIERSGRYNIDCMSSTYFIDLPREAMRSLGGHGTQQGSFYLRRSALEPPAELQAKVFPQVDEWVGKLLSGEVGDDASARGFLQLLKTMRITFLQDAVLIMKDFPHHRIFQHALFKDPLFISFKNSLETVMSTERAPQEYLLQRTLPALTEAMETKFEAQSNMIRELLLQNEQLTKQLTDLTAGRTRVPVRVTVDVNQGTKNITTVYDINAATSPMDIDQSSLSQPIAPPTTNIMDSLNTTTSNIDQQQQSVSELPPTHGWSRSTETVTDLWREYTVGVGGGCAMRDINRNYPNWFIPHSKSFHYRRMRIIKGLEKHARDTDTSIEKCVQLAEARRLEAKKSLDSLGKAVKNIHDLLA